MTLLIDPPVNSMSSVVGIEEWLTELSSWEVIEEDQVLVDREISDAHIWLTSARLREGIEEEP